MKDHPLFSILIASYNASTFIRTALDSAVHQSYDNVEILIVDDCSTDESWPIIQDYAARYKQIIIRKNEKNGGEGYTKRKLVSSSSGEIFGFLDPDDSLIEESVAKMVVAHKDNPATGMIHSKQENCSHHLQPLGLYTGVPLAAGQSLLNRGGSLSHFCTFKRCFYDKTEGLRPGYKLAVDVDLYLKMEEVADILFLPEALYLYRLHENGLSQGHNDARAFFWCLLARYEACKRRSLDPEILLLHDVCEKYSKVGFHGACREILRESSNYLRGKIRGLKSRVSGNR